MDTLERALAAVERELSIRIPRELFRPGGFGPFGEAIDPEALMEPAAGVVRGGELLPDALPFAADGEGGLLALRFGADGHPREVIAWGVAGDWHPSPLVATLPSEAARLRARAEAALENGLAALARQTGPGALAHDLGVARETFSDWLLDARLVPGAARTALRRLTGAEDASLFGQDWEAAAAAALRAAALRPELAWPGALLGWFEEGRGRGPEAARAYAAALLAYEATLDLGGRLVRPGESPARVLAAAHARCGGTVTTPALAAALGGPHAVRAHWLAESDRLRAAGAAAEAWEAALRAGWQRPVRQDMDDVLGRLGDAAEAAARPAWAALARLHLRAWAAR
ncbi:MAG TPA: SMI1/KNR4 family protein [Anaeromyxobacter sp.]|nr:SMI1/KNR4 family protein [Anaeromyxobacter sp.]